MTNLFKRGHDFITQQMQKAGKSSIEYISGNTRTPLKGQLQKTVYHVADGNGILIKMEIRDFMVRVQDLPKLPILGDTIRFNGSVYEVMPVHNENVFKYSDAFKTSIRIHTKEM